MAGQEIQTRRMTRMNSGSKVQLENPIFNDYVLDKNKAIQKKSSTCNKLHIENTVKSGNNIVIPLSTSAYELAKPIITSIINNSSQYYGHFRDSKDSSGATVDSCIRVHNRKIDGIQGKTTKFVINFYHTTSRLLVNGSRVDLFMNDIHELLHRELSKNGHDLTVKSPYKLNN